MKITNEGQIAAVLAELNYSMPPEFDLADTLVALHRAEVEKQFAAAGLEPERLEAIAIGRAVGDTLKVRAGGDVTESFPPISEDSIRRQLSMAEAWGRWVGERAQVLDALTKGMQDALGDHSAEVAKMRLELIQVEDRIVKREVVRAMVQADLRRKLKRWGIAAAVLLLLAIALAPHAKAQQTYTRTDIYRLGGVNLTGGNVVDGVNIAFRVNCVTGCVAGASFADNSAFTFGTTPGSITFYVVDDVAPNTVAENSGGAGRMSTNRIPYFNLRSAAGTEVVTATGTPGASDLGLVVRNIPSGTQTVSDGAGAMNVICDSGCGSTANGTASGALGALNNAVTISGQGTGAINWEIDTGTLVGTVVFEATLDDSTWYAVDAMRINGTVIASTTTFADRGIFTSTGYSQVRLRVSAYTSGTSNARVETSAGASAVRVAQGPTGANAIQTQGTAANGAATVGSPVMVGGKDSSNNARFLLVTTGGQVPIAAAGAAGADAASNNSSQLADSNGSAMSLRTHPFVFNGTTWDRRRGDVNGAWTVGPAASGAAKAGNPLQIGGVFNTTPPTVTTAQMVEAQYTARGEAHTVVRDAAGNIRGMNVNASNQGAVEAFQTTAASLNMRPDTSGATAAAPPARADFVGGLTSGATGGFVTGIAVCDSFVNVNVSTATTTLLVTGVSARQVRICSINLVTAAANNVALISGTGATCGTGTTGMNGGTTAASGWNFGANGGLTQGSGLGEINRTNAAADSVCIVTSAATQLSGRIAYAIY